MTRQPRWYQLECLNALLDYFFTGKTGNPVAALPTGTGKSFIIALFVQYVLSRWPRQRILVLTHVKELIVQNAATFLDYWPEAPVGIYSAGLNQRDAMMPVVFGGCASVVNVIAQIGWRDVLIIDEAHLVNQEANSIYQTIIAELKKINPHLKVIGLTATPYRLGQGMITDGGIFTNLVYDLTTMEAFNRLVAEGFLAPIYPYKPSIEIDAANVSIVGGEYAKGEAEKEADKITVQACWETARVGTMDNRRAWMIYAQGVKHCEHISQVMNGLGIPTTFVHGKVKDRDQRLKDYKAEKYRCMVNYGVFTTGFDHPILDLEVILRLTNSPALWVQILGRLTRPFFAPGYDINTLEGRHAAIAAGSKSRGGLVLDFAGNTARLGPINDPILPKKKGSKSTPGAMPCKLCDKCGCYNHTRATVCCACGAEFDMRPKITATASQQELMRMSDPIVSDHTVSHVLYTQGRSYSSPEVYLCCSYFVGNDKIDERMYLENKYTSGKDARNWWRSRYIGDGTQLRPQSFAGYTPATVSEALNLTQMLRVPLRIRVQNDGKTKKVIGHFWT